MTLGTIDAHQHYWDWSQWTERYQALFAGLAALWRSYLPGELEPQLASAAIERSVVVQVLHDLEETRWMLELARTQPSIAGVVGWVDLTATDTTVADDLDELMADRHFSGIRHLVHEEPDVDWIVRRDVLRGLAVLERNDVAYDLLLRPPHLKHVPTLSEELPDLRMVIDHIAKPLIADGVMEPWASEFRAAAENPRVWCKLSGMVTEARLEAWRPADLAPYIEVALDAFGAERLMYGSDWPVCTLAASYAQVHAALREVLGTLDATTEARIFGGTATEFYGLSE